MFLEKFVVNNPTGLHARPASDLAKLCKSIPADIKIKSGNKEINPKGVLAILTAGIKKGTEIVLEVNGQDEEKYGKEIIAFLDRLSE